jgi:hypothetical protein
MTKRAALVSALLLAGLVVAVISATAALRVIGGGTFGPGGQPLSSADVQRALAQQPAVPQSPLPTQAATARPSASAPVPVSRNFTSGGGTVYAACLSGQAKLTSWIPAQGYAADGYVTGPAAAAWVRFSSSGTELTVTATCRGGQPRFAVAADVRGDGGGHDGGGGGGGGGPGPSGGGR